jgi:transglutaminase-like putative cysteine protease
MLNRRHLLATAGACTAVALLPRNAAAARFDPQPGAWRGFAVTTRLEIAAAGEPVQAWIPLPSVEAADWIVPEADVWNGDAATAEVVTDPRYGARLLHATFAPGEPAPSIEVVSRFRTRDRAVFDTPQATAALPEAERALWLAPTELMPVDGMVKETADRITAGVSGDREKARAIYDWVVDNTERTAATRGCGLGDVASMLETGFLGGKCADLNALYVALARASGLPARDLYGIRVAPSAFGYKSLGANSETIITAPCV